MLRLQHLTCALKTAELITPALCQSSHVKETAHINNHCCTVASGSPMLIFIFLFLLTPVMLISLIGLIIMCEDCDFSPTGIEMSLSVT